MAKRSGFLSASAPQNVCGPQIRVFRRETIGDTGRPMSLEELAARVQEIHGVPMSAAQLSKIENQKKHVLDIQLLALSRVFNIPVAALFPPEETHEPQK